MLCILRVANLSLSQWDCCYCWFCFNSQPKTATTEDEEETGEKNLFMNLTSTIYVWFLFVSPSSIVYIDFRKLVSELSVCLLFAWINSSRRSTSIVADIGYIKYTQK